MTNNIEINIVFDGPARIATLQLFQRGQLMDELIIPLDMNFDTLLVTSIDKILKRNRIDIVHLTKGTISGIVDKSSVAYGIAFTVLEALEAR